MEDDPIRSVEDAVRCTAEDTPKRAELHNFDLPEYVICFVTTKSYWEKIRHEYAIDINTSSSSGFEFEHCHFENMQAKVGLWRNRVTYSMLTFDITLLY